VPHLDVAILKLTSRENLYNSVYKFCKLLFTLWSPKMQLIEERNMKKKFYQFFSNLKESLLSSEKSSSFFSQTKNQLIFDRERIIVQYLACE